MMPFDHDPSGLGRTAPPVRPPARVRTPGPTAPPAPPPGWRAEPLVDDSDVSAALWPGEPEPPRGPRREGLWLALAALAAAVMVVAGLVVYVRTDETAADETAAESADQGSTDQADTSPDSTVPEAPDSTPDSTESESPAIEHAICPDEVNTAICDAARFVETARGRPFKTFPDVQLVDQDAFTERLLRDFDEDVAELGAANHTWRSLGFIDSDVDLVEALTATYEVGVIGVYFADTGELYVKGGEIDLYTLSTVVHELVHAHDDQWFDLLREDYDEADDEVAYGFSAVVEGNARRIEQEWRATLTAQQEAELSALEAAAFGPDELAIYQTIPPLLLQFQISPYVDGLAFVERALADGGENAVDSAIEDPPRTSEQVLHPELYGREEAIVVPRPPLGSTRGDASVVDEGVVGELGFDLWLGDLVGDGWGGDRYVTWTTPEGACTRIDAVGDSASDTEEISRVASGWASDEGPNADRSVESVSVNGREAVRITGCYESP